MQLQSAMIMIIIVLALSSCGPRARIEGEVRDAFGKPLGDVDVSIPNTAFKSATGSNGKYMLPFAPGKFSLTFAKLGYSEYSIIHEVSVETAVPLAVVTLYKKPQENGIWFFGKTDYIPVPPGKLLTGGSDPRNFAWVYQMSYSVDGAFTAIAQQKLYQFMDNVPVPLALLKVGDKGVLAMRSETFGGIGGTQQTVIKEETKDIAKGMTLREVSLGPGRYAYVSLGRDPIMGMNTGRIAAPVFPFEIKP